MNTILVAAAAVQMLCFHSAAELDSVLTQAQMHLVAKGISTQYKGVLTGIYASKDGRWAEFAAKNNNVCIVDSGTDWSAAPWGEAS